MLGIIELYNRKVCEMLQTLRVNNSKILTIKNAKLSWYYFNVNLNIWGDFQICISVPLTQIFVEEMKLIFVDLPCNSKTRNQQY